MIIGTFQFFLAKFQYVFANFTIRECFNNCAEFLRMRQQEVQVERTARFIHSYIVFIFDNFIYPALLRIDDAIIIILRAFLHIKLMAPVGRVTASQIQETTDAVIIYTVSLHFFQIYNDGGNFKGAKISLVNWLYLRFLFENTLFNFLFSTFFFSIFVHSFSSQNNDEYEFMLNLLYMNYLNFHITLETNGYCAEKRPENIRNVIQAEWDKPANRLRNFSIRLSVLVLYNLFSIIYLHIY